MFRFFKTSKRTQSRRTLRADFQAASSVVETWWISRLWNVYIYILYNIYFMQCNINQYNSSWIMIWTSYLVIKTLVFLVSRSNDKRELNCLRFCHRRRCHRLETELAAARRECEGEKSSKKFSHEKCISIRLKNMEKLLKNCEDTRIRIGDFLWWIFVRLKILGGSWRSYKAGSASWRGRSPAAWGWCC